MMGEDALLGGGGHIADRTDIPMGLQGSLELPFYILLVMYGLGHELFSGCKRIGHGSIVGAGAVVTKGVHDWAVVGGNPVKVINTGIIN